MVIILSLAIDPFAQQFVQHKYQFNSTSYDGAYVVRAQRYSKGNEVTSYDGQALLVSLRRLLCLARWIY